VDVQYSNQVDLLLRILPVISRENDFAVHGGSAINLFHNNMPRLSVDIDLTYLPIGTRDNDLAQIKALLFDLRTNLLRAIPRLVVRDPKEEAGEFKLFCSLEGTEVKIEVNTINRGVLCESELYPLCKNAQEKFNQFCEVRVVPKGQLYGGKIVAALDRQHPRDLFDIKVMKNAIGYTQDIWEGFFFCLLSSKRPFHEILRPSLLDHRSTLSSQFSGMANEVFTYDMYELTREWLIKAVNLNLSYEAREFLISFTGGFPEWGRFNYSRFPGIQWKLLNIRKLKQENPIKHESQLLELKKILAE